MLAGKRVVVQVGRAHRCPQQFGKPDRGMLAIGHDGATATEDHREARLREQRGGIGQRLLAAGATLDDDRTGYFALDVAIEEIAGNIQLRRPHFEPRAVERAGGQLGSRLLTCAW